MAENNPKSRYFLRPEAGPIPFENLQWRAKVVLKHIIQALKAAADDIDGGEASPDDEVIDTNRTSRIFFVSGEPGSGKSTLYLTLRAMLSSKKKYSDKYSVGYKEGDLGGLKGAVRWLDPVDLEVAGEEGENLLAAVLVRLFRALDASNSVISNPCEAAIKDLEELATDIGIAWEGNLKDRASALDPDTYSEEVMRAQRARLGVNKRLREALDKLAENKCCGCQNETLFVLPVDDFYLKPHASLELLRLLRMISAPRLFFLVMGDITTVEALFIEKSLADWTAVAGAELFTAMPERLDEAVARARELRARYLRKLLPPGQRAIIEAMDWDEALRFRPEQLDGKQADIKTLGSLFKEEELDAPPESARGEEDESKTDLLEFLVWPPLEHKNEQETASNNGANGFSKKDKDNLSKEEKDKQEKAGQQKKEAQEAYTALQILDATSREVMDLWFKLYNPKTQGENEKTGHPDIPRLLLIVEGFVKLVIEEQNFLTEEEQANLNGVLPTRHYSPRDIQFNMDRLSLEPDPNTWKAQPQEDKDQSKQELWVRQHRSWKLATRTGDGEGKEDPGLFAKLPPRQTAWIVLLHDLAWKWNSESVTGNLVKKLIEEIGVWSLEPQKPSSPSKRDDNTEVDKLTYHHLVNLVARLNKEAAPGKDPLKPDDDFRGWAVWRNGSTYKHFPFPKLHFELFRDLDRFLFVWSSGLEWLNKLWKQVVAAKEKANAAKEKADVARKRVSEAKEQAEPEEEQRQADAAKTQAETEEAQKKAEAEEAQQRVGVTKSEQVSKYIYLWGLAGDTVNNSSYEKFANRNEDWFETELKNFKDLSAVIPGWRKDIGDFEKEVLDTIKVS